MATINGSSRNNSLTGTSADDDIYANGGNDTVRAGTGNDTIFGGTGNDSLLGEGGNDLVYGEVGADLLFGGDGNDSLYGGADNDVLAGGDGNDLLNGGAGTDTLTGGAGVDTADYSDSTAAVTVNLTTGTATGVAIGSDIISEVENITGSAFSDSLTGNAGDNLIEAGAGNDTVVAHSGDDSVYGGAGNDSISAGVSSQPANTSLDFNWSLAGADEANIAGGVVQDTGGIQVTVGFVNDGAATEFSVESSSSIYVGSGEGFNPNSSLFIYGQGTNDNSTTTIDFASVAGSGYADTVENVTFRLADIDRVDGSWEDRITVRAYDANGNEITVILTPTGSDTVSGNTVIAVEGNNASTDAEGSVLVTIPGPVARITIEYDNGFTNGQLIQVSDIQFEAVASDDDLVDGGDGDDTISTGIGADTLFGGSGNDTLDGGAGNDTLDGGTGTDTLFGGDGNDSLTAGDEDDLSYGGAGDDTINFGAGNDTVYGGDGNDVIDDVPGANLAGTNLIYGGNGDDTVWSGFGSDTLYGGAGQDVLSGEDDGDLIFGDTGLDSLFGGNGNDSLFGGDDNDFVYGGVGDDGLSGDSGNDTLFGGDGADTLLGGVGNDSLLGEQGNDSLLGGDGNDVLDSGDNDDLLYGGAGSDTLWGGAGLDVLDGGDGPDFLDGGADQDTIFGGIGDTVTGGSAGTDEDVLDLTAWGKANTNIIFDPNNPENGTVEFLDGSGNVIGTMTFTDIETVVPCFTPGTMILTPRGPCRVEELEVGDLVLTRDNGMQPVRWVGSRSLSLAELVIRPNLRPVRVSQGALGLGLPNRDMLVSPQHRLLIEGSKPEMLFGEREVLVAACHLDGMLGIRQVLTKGITYVHLMFDQHEIVHSDGCWTESFQPGVSVLSGMQDAQRDEVLDLFPELVENPFSYPAARPSLRSFEAKVLLAA